MMKDITIVTAFFDIGRGEYNDFKRSSEVYINWFARWARIKNKLVVYLQDDFIIERVKEIREGYGLLDNTIIVKVDDVYKIEENILSRWEKIENSQDFIDYRDYKRNPENKAKYNYINLLKSYFINETAKKYPQDSYIAWMDFGFEHGGDRFEDENDYSFLWEYDFGDKINLFYLNKIVNEPVFKIVKKLGPDCISGGVLVTPVALAEKFWNLNLESAQILAEIGFMDDDQLIYLMSYRRCPDLFELHKCDWFMPIHDFGGNHIKLKTIVEKKDTLFKKVKRRVKRIIYGR